MTPAIIASEQALALARQAWTEAISTRTCDLLETSLPERECSELEYVDAEHDHDRAKALLERIMGMRMEGA